MRGIVIARGNERFEPVEGKIGFSAHVSGRTETARVSRARRGQHGMRAADAVSRGGAVVRSVVKRL